MDDGQSDVQRRHSELPPDWWRYCGVCQKLSELFRTHLLALHVPFRQGGEQKHEVFSGMLLDLFGMPMWLTAGHVIDTMRAMSTDSTVRMGNARWIDTFPDPRASGMPVDLLALRSFSATPYGHDWGAVHLSPMYARLIQANPKIKFLNPQVWQGAAHARPEGYYLVGMARESNRFTKLGRDSDGSILGKVELDVPCLPVERLEPAGDSPEDFWDVPNAYYGRLLPFAGSTTNGVDDIRGMSGGPVLSIERTDDGQMKYRLFGIQSAWLPTRRILRAVDMTFVGELMCREAGEAFRRAVDAP